MSHSVEYQTNFQNIEEKYKCLIGVIGGTGLEKAFDLEEQILLHTPYGHPSSPIKIGRIGDFNLAYICRHDENHRIIPTEVPYRANIYALKTLGVKYILSMTAVGSLKKEFAPTDFVVVDQFIDRTKKREDTFFGDGMVVHVSFGNPTSQVFSDLIHKTITDLKVPNLTCHRSGTYVCIEGPAFSTKAESEMYIKWGATIVGMTALTEAKLCRESEIAFGCIALVTDYDSWYEEHGVVSNEEVMKTMKKNNMNIKKVLPSILKKIGESKFPSSSHSSLKAAILTNLKTVPKEKMYKWYNILKPYLEEQKKKEEGEEVEGEK